MVQQRMVLYKIYVTKWTLKNKFNKQTGFPQAQQIKTKTNKTTT